MISMACIVIWYQTALKFLGESPLSANLIHNLGTLFYAEKHYQRARVCFKRALLCRADLHEAQDSLDTANSFVRTQCLWSRFRSAFAQTFHGRNTCAAGAGSVALRHVERWRAQSQIPVGYYSGSYTRSGGARALYCARHWHRLRHPCHVGYITVTSEQNNGYMSVTYGLYDS